MSASDDLLTVQAHDTHLDQLRHRRDTLPERVAFEENVASRAAFERETGQATAARDVVIKEQRRLEDDIALVVAHASEVYDKLYSGSTTAMRELQALQDDHASLKRRQTELEDRDLELMEALEPIDANLAALAARADVLDAEGAQASAALEAAEGAVDTEIADEQIVRDELAASIPPALLKEYERRRAQFGGIAVAKLEGSACHGCDLNLTLSPFELDRIRATPPDTVIDCDECGRMIVR